MRCKHGPATEHLGAVHTVFVDKPGLLANPVTPLNVDHDWFGKIGRFRRNAKKSKGGPGNSE